METGAATYLYTLAMLAITFTGFSALITALRQTSGGPLSRYDAFLTTNYFITGFAVAVLCLLPPLLSAFTPSRTAIWQVPSAIAFVIGILVELAALVRGRGVPNGLRSQYLVGILMISYWPALLLMLLSACSLGIRPGFGPFAAALTWIFAVLGVDYVVGLSVLFRMQLPQ